MEMEAKKHLSDLIKTSEHIDKEFFLVKYLSSLL
jgi:hypothetical protein